MQAPSKRSRRGVATVVLVVLTCVLALLSSVAMWLRALVLNTDSYVKAVAPVLDRADVRDALAASIVAQLYTHVDVAEVLREALPKDAKTFAPTLAASIRETSEKLAATALGTAAVKKVWRESNRVAHDQLVHVLEGNGKVVTTNNGEIALDTGQLARSVRQSLDDAGIHVFDSVSVDALSARYVIFKSKDLVHAQQATTVLDDLGIWLPIATVACGAGAIACSTRRRRTVEILALAIAAVMVLIVVGAAVGRSVYLGEVGNVVAPAVGAALFDALVRPLRTGVRVVFVAAVVVWAAAWLSGSRTALEREEQMRTIVFDRTRRYARPLAIGGVVAAALVLVAWDRPRPLVVGSILLLLALWEGVILLSERTVRKTG